MRLQTLRLVDFKRFHDLTIDLTPRLTKIVALVGPNGSGKSSVFDGFEEFGSQFKGRGGKRDAYYKKSLFDELTPSTQGYDLSQSVRLTSDQPSYTRTSFYIRSAHRFTPRLTVNTIRKLEDIETDNNRPQYLVDADARLQDNYERLMGRFFDDVYNEELTGKAWAEQNIEGLNAVLSKVLDIRVSFLGNPVHNEGSLYFEKGSSKKFPYENLSAGEKEVVDLVLDLYVKRRVYTNSVICIDEPELHLNTAIQRRMLEELEKLVPDGSQLWVATHSIGFLRALQEDLWEKTAVIDFAGGDFDSTVTLVPIAGTRGDWTRIFATALEDLTGLLAPRRIVYCEGREQPAPGNTDQGLDAEVYNEVFAYSHSDTLFVSSGGGGAARRNALLALRVLKKALTEVEFLLLRDRDVNSDADRNAFLTADPSNRMLLRREIENYLFDKEVLEAFCISSGATFDEARYDAAVTDIVNQDLKPIQQQIQACCGSAVSMDAFKRSLSQHIAPTTAAYIELERLVF